MASKPPIFSVSNKHIADSGKPPQIDGDTANRYHGYFGNEYGEQALFTYDYQRETGTLWMGNNGWEKPVPVIGGKAQGLILGEAETNWLQACWGIADMMLRGGAR